MLSNQFMSEVLIPTSVHSLHCSPALTLLTSMAHLFLHVNVFFSQVNQFPHLPLFATATWHTITFHINLKLQFPSFKCCFSGFFICFQQLTSQLFSCSFNISGFLMCNQVIIQYIIYYYIIHTHLYILDYSMIGMIIRCNARLYVVVEITST